MGQVCSAIVEHRHSGRGDGSSSLLSPSLYEANRSTFNLGVKKLPTPVRSSLFSESKLSPPGSVISPEGRRRSLLVGINYYDTQDELHGGVNDVMRMVPVLAKAGFPCNSENQRVLTDGPRAGTEQRPTRANILEALAWLVEGAEKGDALFFHYSGHGGRNGSTSGKGQFRETLVPVDFETAGLLDEQVVSKELLEKLPEGCRMTCLIDSAHGAGAPVGLPSMFIGDSSSIGAVKHGGAAMGRGVQKATSFSKRRGEPMQPAAEVLVITSREKELHSWSNRGPESEDRLRKKRFGNTTEGAISIPSDISVPTGALYVDPSRAPGGSNWGLGGVLTSAFTEVLSRPKEEALTLLAVMEKINQEFQNRGYMQVPLMAASKILDLKQRLELDTWLC